MSKDEKKQIAEQLKKFAGFSKIKVSLKQEFNTLICTIRDQGSFDFVKALSFYSESEEIDLYHNHMNKDSSEFYIIERLLGIMNSTATTIEDETNNFDDWSSHISIVRILNK